MMPALSLKLPPPEPETYAQQEKRAFLKAARHAARQRRQDHIVRPFKHARKARHALLALTLFQIRKRAAAPAAAPRDAR